MTQYFKLKKKDEGYLIAEGAYILETLRTEFREADTEADEFTLEATEMTQEEVENLPEWDGW